MHTAGFLLVKKCVKIEIASVNCACSSVKRYCWNSTDDCTLYRLTVAKRSPKVMGQRLPLPVRVHEIVKSVGWWGWKGRNVNPYKIILSTQVNLRHRKNRLRQFLKAGLLAQCLLSPTAVLRSCDRAQGHHQ